MRSRSTDLLILGLLSVYSLLTSVARAEDYLRVDVVATGALGLDAQDRCERDSDTVGCTTPTLLPTLELGVEVRPWRMLGLGAFVGLSRRADRSETVSSDGTRRSAEADRLTRYGLELRLHPFPVFLSGAFLAAEGGALRFIGASDQAAAFVGGAAGYDFALLSRLLLGVGARLEYFALDASDTGLPPAMTTSYAPGPRFWLGLRVGVTFGSD